MSTDIPSLHLRMLRSGDEPALQRAIGSTQGEAIAFLHHYDPSRSFEAYAELLAQKSRGEALVGSEVPATFLFAFEGDEIVGRVSIRHCLNDWLRKVGGHIGYVVVPEHRGRGVATEILRQAVECAASLGIDELRLTTDVENPGSRRVIEKNGGVLVRTSDPTETGDAKCHYVIAAR